MPRDKALIGSESLLRAENKLKRTYALNTGDPQLIYDRALIDRTAANTYIAAHSDMLFRQYMPDIDPRQEPAIRTMFAHFLCVGAIAQRMADGKDY